MAKQSNISTKDYIIRKMSHSLNIPEKRIEMVVNHQFDSLREGLKKHYTMELSGFGKWIYNVNKAKKILLKEYSKKETFTNKMNEPGITEAKRQSWQNKLNNTLATIAQIESKLNHE